MNPQDRTKRLMLIAGGSLGVLIGYYLLNWTVFTPIKTQKKKIENLDTDLASYQNQSDMLDIARLRLAQWGATSPPPNPNDAQRLYKQWIRDLVNIAGFVDPEVESRSQTSKQRGRLKIYTSVPVTVKGKITFPQLCRFLYYFHRTNLMHRIADLDVRSDGNEGNPLMTVRMTCEAIAMASARRRQQLFPETKLKQPLNAGDNSITVTGAKGFPKKAPFQIRIGRQFLTVTDVKGNTWKIRPGVDPPPENEIESIESREAGAVVQLNPMTIVKDQLLADYRKAVYSRYANPFVLPMEFSPSLRINGNTRLARGDDLRLKATARDLDPDKGKARFELSKDAPKGMTIDAKSGDIRWTPAKDAEAKSYRAEVRLYQGNGKEPLLTRRVDVSIRVPNNRPTLTVAKDSHEIFAGSSVKFQASAKDPDGQRVSFSLSGAPAGATIDSKNGAFEWTPDDDIEPKMYSFDVIARDSGSPSQSDKKTIYINVKQKAERYTRLIGTFVEGAQREAIFYDIANNKKFTVNEGTPFEIAGISGFLYVVGQGFVEFQSGDDSYRLRDGKFLSNRIKLKPAKAKKTSK